MDKYHYMKQLQHWWQYQYPQTIQKIPKQIPTLKQLFEIRSPLIFITMLIVINSPWWVTAIINLNHIRIAMSKTSQWENLISMNLTISYIAIFIMNRYRWWYIIYVINWKITHYYKHFKHRMKK